MLSFRDRLAFALDYPDLQSAQAGAESVQHEVGVLKVGLELFIQAGPAAVKMAQSLGLKVFLDLKLHDISKTVERAVGTACDLGVDYLTLHAGGGPKMLELAAARVSQSSSSLQLLGVTVLTSLDQSDLSAVGVNASPGEQAERLAQLAQSSGLAGLVCSTNEVASLRRLVGEKMLLVTPGIRPAGASLGDQKRVGTPSEAVRAGASLLVVGRPIRDAADPAAAARSIINELENAQ